MKNKTWLYWLFFLALFTAPFYLTEFRLSLLGKFLCFAIIAVGISLIWGYTGILSLGHGVYFGLGAYCMAMYLKLEDSRGHLPDFMEWSGVEKLPWFWKPFENPLFAIFSAIIIPVLLAAFLSYFTFKNRIKGVYFSLLSQAVVVVFVTLFIGKQEWTGGTNGLTNFSTVFGFSLSSPLTQIVIYLLTVLLLCFIFIFSRWLTRSRFGRVLIAIRDSENRVRFLGFNTTTYKVFVYSLSAAFAGLAGVMFVLQVGLISPAMMGIIPSIEMVLWVAVGGRNSLIGAIIGAIATNSAKSFFSENYPDIWLLFLGGLFISIVMFLPNGLAGLYESFVQRKGRRERRKNEAGSHVSRSVS
ncbi:urea ABC transporter membrane protein /amino acid/amide ABC transporter membrane protein 2 (HAAT family) [Anoxybacillus vitaminiphilus]|jgi:urea transport system permease protein|uniref:Urea ABC transporter membrane protein /amino acid/amide ABC transporter membrane protein 2 (HAAT family) n=1 Tax=Paranoxybacillus vitaminiphilus TaxID=581036 RepID=A0A327Y478_9BACL|nr:urea ABC transporter permease subunit UrtC [Anoxybacillus vitaminiphilus]RAK15191.1 urea ABC transporter membrane protein /amino acid/amide ABC transporter membrane protein 2 (HAAT family) [Anoxybacillus vitaminiphilus]